MSQAVETATKTFIAGAAIAAHRRVKLSSGKLAVAGLGLVDEPVEIGTIEQASFADGDAVSVRLRSATGTCKMVALDAISVGDLVYGTSNGRIRSSATSGDPLGIALEAATALDDVIEVLRR